MTEVSPPAWAPRFEPDEGWVPADERRFGLDRRTLRPTLAVFALVFVMSVVLPVMQIDGEGTFVPEPGGGVTSGVRTRHAPISGQYPASATVEDGALKFTVRTGSFHGDADQLLDQIEATSDALNQGRGVHITGAPTTIVTAAGKQGATVRVTGPHTAGLIAAFVFDDRGVEAVATGPTDAGAEPSAAVLRMIGSIKESKQDKR